MRIEEGKLLIGGAEIMPDMTYQRVKSDLEAVKELTGKDFYFSENLINVGKQNFCDMIFDCDLLFFEDRLNRFFLNPLPDQYGGIKEEELSKKIFELAKDHRRAMEKSLGPAFYKDDFSFLYIVGNLLFVSQISEESDHYSVIVEDALSAICHDQAYALASKRLFEGGRRVDYMYREKADNAEDSGWRFFLADEGEEYINNADNIGLYPLSRIAESDRSILPFLLENEGSAFERGPDGHFIRLED